MPAYSLTGGWMALVLVTYSFIADNSSTRFTFYNTNKKDIPEHIIVFSSSNYFSSFQGQIYQTSSNGYNVGPLLLCCSSPGSISV